MNKTIYWEVLDFPNVLKGFLISPEGFVRFKDSEDSSYLTADYHSTNGYDFILLMNQELKLQLFPIDALVASVYIPIPKELEYKNIIVNHKNGDTRDISLANLEWIEDIEIWSHNIKITEEQRVELLKLLKDNNNSPAKTFKIIETLPEFSNVTVYDLKYLKRKYL